MPEMIARFKPGENVSGFCVTQVLGGRLVKVVAPKTERGDYSIGHCGAGDKAFGVAERDSAAATAPAHEQSRLVNVVRRGAIARVTAGAAITAGDEVQSDAAGQAITLAGGTAVGRAMNTVGSGGIVEVDLY